MLLCCSLDSFLDNGVDVLDTCCNHLSLLFVRVNTVGHLIVDLFIFELSKGQLKDLAATVFTVVHESEVSTAIVVFQGEPSLVGSGIVHALLEKGFDHTGETVIVDREVVVHLQGHVVFVRHCALVEELYVGLGGDLEAY